MQDAGRTSRSHHCDGTLLSSLISATRRISFRHVIQLSSDVFIQNSFQQSNVTVIQSSTLLTFAPPFKAHPGVFQHSNSQQDDVKAHFYHSDCGAWPADRRHSRRPTGWVPATSRRVGDGRGRNEASPPPMIAGEYRVCRGDSTLSGVVRHAKRRRVVRWPTAAPPSRSLVAHAQLKAAQLPLFLPLPFLLAFCFVQQHRHLHPASDISRFLSLLHISCLCIPFSKDFCCSATTPSYVDSSVFQAKLPATTAIRPARGQLLYLQPDSPKPAHLSPLDSNCQDCFVCLLFC